MLLLIEVSESSLGFDTGRKSAPYARCGIPELWVLDLDARNLQVRRAPSATGFESWQVLERGTITSPLALPNARFDWGAIFD